MIRFEIGDILISPVEAIVNPVNCVGVMGKGLALQFKNKYPDNFIAYVDACKQQEVVLGKMFVWEDPKAEGTKRRYIINFPTKLHWRNHSYISDIQAGLDDLIQVIKKYNIKSIAIPPLGAGLGELPWKDVKSVICEKLFHLKDSMEIIIYEPWGEDTITNIRELVREYARTTDIFDQDPTKI